MGLSTAERNRRKRERKKKEREEQRRQEQVEAKEESTTAAVASLPKSEDDVEIEYVAEPVLPHSAAGGLPEGLPPDMNGQQPESMAAVLRRFHQRAALTAVVISDDERGADNGSSSGGKPPDKYSSSDEEDDEDEKKPMSKRKLRELTRPTVAELKRRVKRPDLVEAHDITAEYPDFLIHLKSIPGTVPVPRHWGRKRKYLQGKRGFEKPPFQVWSKNVCALNTQYAYLSLAS
jgi:splicing factor 3B subunit 2